jgi:ABC-type multidrug transport system fused ATPase/permease subunit
MQTFKKLFFLLTLKERKSAGLLLLMISFMTLLDMIGVASILPFLAVLTNTDLIESNLILSKIFQFSQNFGVEDNKHFLFVLGLLMFIILVVSLIFRALTTYIQLRFVQMSEYSISKRLLEGYLYQPYSFFLSNHSTDLSKTILSEVNLIVSKGIREMMELIAYGMLAIAIIILLIIANPKLAMIVGFSLGGAYSLIFFLIRGHLDKIGRQRLKNNTLRYLTVGEAFGAAKVIKVSGLEKTYIELYSSSALIFARSQASSLLIAQLPRFFLEAIAFGGILLMILFMMSQTGSFNNSLPVIGLYVFAGYRLMPALQRIYASFTQLTFVGPALNKLFTEVKNIKLTNLDYDKEILNFDKAITLKNISYNYPNTSRTTLENISLNIPAKTTVALVGPTGCGKTTTVDIILGLIEAQKGSLEVDGKNITKQNVRSWQNLIGYVPQNVYLIDDSIMANIAFGEKLENINQEAVEKASRIANLHEFVTTELPNKYFTKVGERGVRLSGGQIQRIGIARALYHNPKVLILDEATSALDNETEKVVMDAVSNLRREVTIILIAHRLNTVKNCDIIFKLENGQLVGQGSFDELINS